MRVFLVVLALLLLAAPARAQSEWVPPVAKTVNLSGPRFGITLLDSDVVAKLHERGLQVSPVITQFGWQLEKQIVSSGSGLTAVTEWVFLAGGLEQSVMIPSVTWMVGVRSATGAEFGVGPNITPAGTALAVAGGVTFRAGVMNIPVNVAIVPSKAGTRISFLTGFNFRNESRARRVSAPPRRVGLPRGPVSLPPIGAPPGPRVRW